MEESVNGRKKERCDSGRVIRTGKKEENSHVEDKITPN